MRRLSSLSQPSCVCACCSFEGSDRAVDGSLLVVAPIMFGGGGLCFVLVV